MGVVDGFKGASILCKVAFILLLIASLFTCISYTTTAWVYDDNDNGGANYWGLWRSCPSTDFVGGGCSQLDGWANGWYGVVQAFVTFGFFGILVSFLLVILYMFFGSCQKNAEVAIAVAIICIVTGILYMIGVIIFGVKVDDYWIDSNAANIKYKLGYSFALSVVALVLEIVAGVLMIVEGKGGGGGTKPSA